METISKHTKNLKERNRESISISHEEKEGKRKLFVIVERISHVFMKISRI